MKSSFVSAVLALAMGTVLAWPLEAGAQSSAEPGVPQGPMMLDPFLPEPPTIQRFNPGLKAAWQACFTQTDTETLRRTADAIGAAALGGMEGLSVFAPKLRTLLDAPNQHPILQLACARALFRMGDKTSAASLLAHNQHDGTDMLLLTDPALAAWDFAPARAVWLARLEDPATPRSALASAIASLGLVHDASAAPKIQAIVTDASRDASLRLLAAQHLAALAPEHLDTQAQTLTLAGPGHMTDRLLAATLLKGATGGDVRGQLTKLALDPESAVAAIALQRLIALDPAFLEPVRATLAVHADPAMRLLVIGGLAKQKNPQTVADVGPFLNDANLHVRMAACKAMIDLDKEPALRDAVRTAAKSMLATGGAPGRLHGQEQAAIMLGEVGDTSAAPLLVDLLAVPDGAVQLAAVTALRKLAVPETLPAVLRHGVELFASVDAAKNPGVNPNALLTRWNDNQINAQLAEIAQLLGFRRYAAAHAWLQVFVAKGQLYSPEARGAAIWALGMIHADAGDPELASAFMQRLGDTQGETPEDSFVRRMCAISLGRMRTKGAVGLLNKTIQLEDKSSEMGRACQWALAKIAGTANPDISAEPLIQENSVGFITPQSN